MKFLAFNVRPDEREHFEETAARLGADIVLRDDTPSPGNADAVKGMDGLSIITQPVSAALLEAWAARGIRAVSTRTWVLTTSTSLPPHGSASPFPT